MNLTKFINSLLYDGQIVLGEYQHIPENEIRAATEQVEDFERLFRSEMPAGPPEFNSDAALWATVSFYRACQFAMYREIDAAEIEAEFAKYDPPDDSASSHYSVHLVFRFLPDLVRLTKTLSAEDPLGLILLNWGQQWPMSSLAVQELGALNLETVVADDSLRQFYVEQILRHRESSRITSAPIRDLVCIALGESDAWTAELLTMEFSD